MTVKIELQLGWRPEERPGRFTLEAFDRHYRHWIPVHEGVPRTQVYVGADTAWLLQEGSVWSNRVAALRLTERSAAKRIREILEPFRTQGRGVGSWVRPLADPKGLEEHLRSNGLRCRKHFPCMNMDFLGLAEDPGPPVE